MSLAILRSTGRLPLPEADRDPSVRFSKKDEDSAFGALKEGVAKILCLTVSAWNEWNAIIHVKIEVVKSILISTDVDFGDTPGVFEEKVEDVIFG